MPIPGTASSPRPCVDSWVARQETDATIALCPLQDRPIHVLAELDPTRDHHPGLATVLGSNRHIHPHVRTRREHGNRQTSCIVPLLPDVETSAGVRRTGAANIFACTIIRPVPEFLGHASGPIVVVVSQPRRHLILAHWMCDPSVTSNARGKERQGSRKLPHHASR